ncbi:MAG TPA: hypothetical protein VG013_00710 [Gemmataceae bacterium]|nr:hypothetical protein [Gemmataceae bacterium]
MSGIDPSVSSELAARVANELDAGERLIWAGQPRLDLAMRSAYLLVPCGVVFTGFALVWIVVAVVVSAGLMAPCSLPFVAVGILLMASPVWLRRRARQTMYALTDRRAIVWEPAWWGTVTVRDYTAAGLGRMSRTERADGSGDLVFEEFTTVSSSSNGTTSSTTRRGFLAIDHVREVEDLVRRTLLAPPGGS